MKNIIYILYFKNFLLLLKIVLKILLRCLSIPSLFFVISSLSTLLEFLGSILIHMYKIYSIYFFCILLYILSIYCANYILVQKYVNSVLHFIRYTLSSSLLNTLSKDLLDIVFVVLFFCEILWEMIMKILYFNKF